MLCTKQQLFVERITRSKYRHSPGEMQNFVLYPTVHTVGYHWASRVTRYYVVPFVVKMVVDGSQTAAAPYHLQKVSSIGIKQAVCVP